MWKISSSWSSIFTSLDDIISENIGCFLLCKLRKDWLNSFTTDFSYNNSFTTDFSYFISFAKFLIVCKLRPNSIGLISFSYDSFWFASDIYWGCKLRRNSLGLISFSYDSIWFAHDIYSDPIYSLLILFKIFSNHVSKCLLIRKQS